MSVADLHAMIVPIQLSDAVPEEVRREFDTARSAFVYAWFVYEFSTLAELAGYMGLELAISRRMDPAPPNTSRSPGLGRLLQMAIEKRYLERLILKCSRRPGAARWLASSTSYRCCVTTLPTGTFTCFHRAHLNLFGCVEL